MNKNLTKSENVETTASNCADKLFTTFGKKYFKDINDAKQRIKDLRLSLRNKAAAVLRNVGGMSIAAFPGAGKSYLVDFANTRLEQGNTVLDLDFGIINANKVAKHVGFKGSIAYYESMIDCLTLWPNDSIVFINEPRAYANIYFIPFPDEITKRAWLKRITSRDGAKSDLARRMRANYFSWIDSWCKAAEAINASIVFMKARDDGELVNLYNILIDSEDKLLIEHSLESDSTLDKISNGLVYSISKELR